MRRLPNWADGNRALKALGVLLRKERLDRLVQTSFAELPASGGVRVLLPAHTMFDSFDGVKAVEWCVPPTADMSLLITGYDGYTDRRLGSFPNPNMVAAKAFGKNTGRTFMKGQYRPSDWWGPVMKLLAVAHRAPGSLLTLHADGAEVEVDGYRMKVTASGVWSNYLGRMVTTSAAPTDLDFRALGIPAQVTDHPLAGALKMHGASAACLACVGHVVMAEADKLIPPVAPAAIKLLFRGRGPMPKRKGPDHRLIQGALGGMLDELQNPGGADLDHLRTIAVPVLMPASRFSDMLDSAGGEAVLTPAAVTKLLRFVETRAEAL